MEQNEYTQCTQWGMYQFLYSPTDLLYFDDNYKYDRRYRKKGSNELSKYIIKKSFVRNHKKKFENTQ